MVATTIQLFVHGCCNVCNKQYEWFLIIVLFPIMVVFLHTYHCYLIVVWLLQWWYHCIVDSTIIIVLLQPYIVAMTITVLVGAQWLVQPYNCNLKIQLLFDCPCDCCNDTNVVTIPLFFDHCVVVAINVFRWFYWYNDYHCQC